MKYFGTDGIRGEYGVVLTKDLIERIAYSVVRILNKNDKVVLGYDSRESSLAIKEKFINILTANNIDVINLGMIPTPHVSLMIKKLNANLGIMISASHNPYYDNGIKIFGPNGIKITDELELKIENHIDNDNFIDLNQKITQTETNYDSYNDYYELVKKITTDLSGVNIYLDCANGASSYLAPKIFYQLNANVNVMANKPNGKNINDGVGALHPENLAQKVEQGNYDCGFCYDGDADRIIVITPKGNILTGDHIIYLIAKEMKKLNELKNNEVVITVMSNLGLKKELSKLNIKQEITSVGDRFVIEEMEKKELNLGGEQSGHIILADYIPTGDGILTSIYIANLIKQGINLDDIYNEMEIFPQKLVNLKVNDKETIMKNEELKALINQVELELNDNGRVLIRPSGTEELIRVMIEANQEEIIDKYMKKFIDLIEKIK